MKLGKFAAITSTGLLGLGVLQAEDTSGHDLVMKSIEVHGGKEKWYGSGQLQFRWTYHMTDRGADVVVDTVQTVDPNSLAVKHEVAGKDITFGFNDGVDWIRPVGTEFTPPHRFWALTPTYFLGIPFVFNDENASFEILPDAMEFEGEKYTQVKITYNEKAGDSPDDYYVLLINPETKVTRGAYYTVTSDLLGRDQPGPPKFISLDDLQDIGGVMLAGGHRTFKMSDGLIGDQMRYTEVSGVKWLPAGSVDLGVPK